MASQKQINFVNKIEKRIKKKYQGSYDIGSISNFIDKNIVEYRRTLGISDRFFKDTPVDKEEAIQHEIADLINTDDQLYELINEEF